MPRETIVDSVALADLLGRCACLEVKRRLGRTRPSSSRPVWSTGRSSLDARLPGGGWPTASLIEVLLDAAGLGEVQLFLPALVECQRKTDGEPPWLVWIAPPHEPYAPSLAQQGIELRRLLVVRPSTATEALWAAEQALSSGVCAAVLLWLKGTDDRWLRRLKLAAEAGGALGILFRPERHRFESSPATLRLLLTQGEHEPHLELLKVQGGAAGSRRAGVMKSRARRGPRRRIYLRMHRRLRITRPCLRLRTAPAPAPAAAPPPVARSRPKHLWYAAVFPELTEIENSARSTPAPLPACAAIHFAGQYGNAQRLIAGDQRQREVVRFARSIACGHRCRLGWAETACPQRDGAIASGGAVVRPRRQAGTHRRSRLAGGCTGGAAHRLHVLGCRSGCTPCAPWA